MASQRRAPTKRPPRPAAKKTPSPPTSEGTDGSEGAATSGTAAPERVSKSARPGAVPTAKGPSSPTARATTGTKSGPTPNAKADAATGGGAKATTTSAKGAPSSGVTKTNSGGGNYRPPTGASRNRRPPPPPKKKRPMFTRRTVGAAVALALIGTLVVFFSVAVNGNSSSPALNAALTPEGLAVPKGPALASVNSAQYPQPIDGIQCQANEQVVFHIHAHISIFVDGAARQIPYGIGIGTPLNVATTKGSFVNGGSCFYWLHTHAADGLIHIESPTQISYTLGQFFDEWGQPLKSGQVGPAVGPTTVYVNGKIFTGDPRTIQFAAHSEIQLDVGVPAPAPVTVAFPSGL